MATGTDAILSGGPETATGGICLAPLGTTLPTDAKADLAAAFTKLGYVNGDGVEKSQEISEEKVKEWSGMVVKILRTEFSETYKFTLLEAANPNVLKGIFGEERVTVNNGLIAIKSNAEALALQVFVFNMLDGKFKTRIVVPRGQLKTSGSVKYNKKGVAEYECEVEAFPDESGNVSYTYIQELEPPRAPSGQGSAKQGA